MSTGIEWTDETWNPVTGCTKVSQGCKHCYAERVFPRVYGRDYVDLPHSESATEWPVRPRRFTDIALHHDRLSQPLSWKRPRRIFVNSMSDLFHEAVPDQFIDQIFAVMALASQHTFQILTKRPERMRMYFSKLAESDPVMDGIGRWHAEGAKILQGVTDDQWESLMSDDIPLSNVWLGVSCENQETADQRIPLLLQTSAAVRFVSCEPLLGPVTLKQIWLDGRALDQYSAHVGFNPRLHWLIAGGESGPNARPSHPDWFRSLRDQCAAASVPFFFKQWGEYGFKADLRPEVMDEFGFPPTERPAWMQRMGKKAAGALLDGREHKEWPTSQQEQH